jgi:hypothetical protein
MSNKVHELKPRLFDAGEVSITAEAFQRLKEAQVEPELLLERHTRGDWSGAPVKWIEKNYLRFRGVKDYPVMSVYQLHPSENRVCVATDADLSKTSITNWPNGDHKAPLLPLKAMEAGYQVTKRAIEKGSFARDLMDRMGAPAKSPKSPKEKQKSRDMDISR